MVGWRSWLCVCVCVPGGCLGCSGQKRGVAAVRVLVHVWVNKGRKGQPGRGDSGSEVLKHKISLSPSLSLLLGQTQSNSNLCDFTAHRIPKTLTALCWGGGNEGVGGRDGGNEEKCRDGRMERQTLQTRKWQWKVKMDRLEEKQAADDWSEGEETGTQEICILHF